MNLFSKPDALALAKTQLAEAQRSLVQWKLQELSVKSQVSTLENQVEWLKLHLETLAPKPIYTPALSRSEKTNV